MFRTQLQKKKTFLLRFFWCLEMRDTFLFGATTPESDPPQCKLGENITELQPDAQQRKVYYNEPCMTLAAVEKSTSGCHAVDPRNRRVLAQSGHFQMKNGETCKLEGEELKEYHEFIRTSVSNLTEARAKADANAEKKATEIESLTQILTQSQAYEESTQQTIADLRQQKQELEYLHREQQGRDQLHLRQLQRAVAELDATQREDKPKIEEMKTAMQEYAGAQAKLEEAKKTQRERDVGLRTWAEFEITVDRLAGQDVDSALTSLDKFEQENDGNSLLFGSEFRLLLQAKRNHLNEMKKFAESMKKLKDAHTAARQKMTAKELLKDTEIKERTKEIEDLSLEMLANQERVKNANSQLVKVMQDNLTSFTINEDNAEVNCQEKVLQQRIGNAKQALERYKNETGLSAEVKGWVDYMESWEQNCELICEKFNKLGSLKDSVENAGVMLQLHVGTTNTDLLQRIEETNRELAKANAREMALQAVAEEASAAKESAEAKLKELSERSQTYTTEITRQQNGVMEKTLKVIKDVMGVFETSSLQGSVDQSNLNNFIAGLQDLRAKQVAAEATDPDPATPEILRTLDDAIETLEQYRVVDPNGAASSTSEIETNQDTAIVPSPPRDIVPSQRTGGGITGLLPGIGTVLSPLMRTGGVLTGLQAGNVSSTVPRVGSDGTIVSRVQDSDGIVPQGGGWLPGWLSSNDAARLWDALDALTLGKLNRVASKLRSGRDALMIGAAAGKDAVTNYFYPKQEDVPESVHYNVDTLRKVIAIKDPIDTFSVDPSMDELIEKTSAMTKSLTTSDEPKTTRMQAIARQFPFNEKLFLRCKNDIQRIFGDRFEDEELTNQIKDRYGKIVRIWQKVILRQIQDEVVEGGLGERDAIQEEVTNRFTKEQEEMLFKVFDDRYHQNLSTRPYDITGDPPRSQPQPGRARVAPAALEPVGTLGALERARQGNARQASTRLQSGAASSSFPPVVGEGGGVGGGGEGSGDAGGGGGRAAIPVADWVRDQPLLP